ncbi:MAG TPA: hypothetical protein VIK89_09705 [Cytophagaceae bacterium]
MKVKLKPNSYALLSLVLIFNFIFPTFNFYFDDKASTGSIILNSILLLLSIGLMLLKNTIYDGKVFRSSVIFFGLFSMVISLSILFNLKDFIIRDLFELHRPVFYASAFLLPQFFFWDRKKIEKHIFLPVMIVLIYEILLGIAALNKTETIKYFLSLYTKNHNVISGRATGTFVNPYDYAYMMVFFATCSIYLFIKTKKLIYLIKSILSIYVTLISQSRTGFIILLLALIYLMIFLIVSNKNMSVKFKMLIMSTFLITAILTAFGTIERLLKENYPYLYSGLYSLINKDISEVSSFNARLEQLIWALNEFSKSPVTVIIGNGPGKGIREYLEMQYIVYFYRYGTIGLFVCIVYLFYGVYITSRAYFYSRKKEYGVKTEALWIGLNCLAVVTPIASMSNNFIDQIRISYFLFFMMGLATAVTRQDDIVKPGIIKN